MNVGTITIWMVDTTRSYSINRTISHKYRVIWWTIYLRYWSVNDWQKQCQAVMLILQEIVVDENREDKGGCSYLVPVLDWLDWVLRSRQQSWCNVESQSNHFDQSELHKIPEEEIVSENDWSGRVDGLLVVLFDHRLVSMWEWCTIHHSCQGQGRLPFFSCTMVR